MKKIQGSHTPAPNEKMCYRLLQKCYFSFFCSKMYFFFFFHACADFLFLTIKQECSVSNLNFTKNLMQLGRKIVNFFNIFQNNNGTQENRTFKKYQWQEKLIFLSISIQKQLLKLVDFLQNNVFEGKKKPCSFKKYQPRRKFIF